MWFVTVLAIASAIFSAALFFAPLIIAWLHPLLDKVPLGGRGNSLVHYIFDIPFVFAVHIYESIQRTKHKTATRSQFRGPGSFAVFRNLLFFIWILVCIHLAWGEGCDTSMGVTKAELTQSFRPYSVSAKRHGQGPRKSCESLQTDRKRTVCKRSYRRALNRAATHGVTWYKGQLCTASQLGVEVHPQLVPPVTKNIAPPKSTQRHRLTCFSWNCNGLPSQSWDYMMMWLEKQDIDILYFQETHWPFTREWESNKYLLVHSGTQTKQAGLLCMISKRICNPSELSWHEHIPGRLVQLRIHGKNRCIDLINVYQYTCIASHMELRNQVWHQLFTLLQTFSRKNVLIMGGDFNCSAIQHSDAIGIPTFRNGNTRCHGPRHPDTDQWHQLLLQFDLTALNTWNSSDMATYIFGTHASRIDFICTRRIHADSTARDVKHLRDFTLVPLTGAHHVPLLTSLRREWYSEPPQRPVGWSRQQRMILHQQCVQRGSFFDAFCEQVNDTVHHLIHTQDSDLTTLHIALQQYKGPTSSSSSHGMKSQPDVRPFQRFQDHTRRLRLIQSTALPGVFQAWFHVFQRSRARREMSEASKFSRRHRLDQVFNAAAQAEQAKDHFTLFQHIRSLSPKQPMKRIMLRSGQGELLGPEDSANWLQKWYQDLYSDGSLATSILSFEWPFTQTALAQGLQTLPSNKALAPAYAPAPFWKYGAEPIAQFLDPMLHSCSSNKQFPASWGVGHVAMLIKPGKRGQHPSELRPIALLEPSGKTVMGMVTNAIQQQIQSDLNRLPQFAYAGGRGTEDAIHRLANHCRSVRQLMCDYSYPVHRHKQGLPLPSLIGGMILSLDLTRAFDMVDRSRLFSSMQRLGISDDLISILQCVYNTTTYEFEHRGVFRSVDTRKGIRQGCRAAPCLWTVFISVLMMDIEQHLSQQFLLYCTIFADDLCSHQIFHNEADFLALIKAFGTLLDLIAAAKLEVNLAKTTVTLRMRGQMMHKLQRKFIVRTQHGAFLKIPRADGSHTRIRLVKSFKYLGIVFSYYNFESETMALRLKHSAQTSHQLHRWLYTQKMSVSQRVKLWYQCTYSCLRYGILATGFTETSLISFYRFCIEQLRRLHRDPVHLSHETNQDFLTRCQLPDPLLRLRELCLQTAGRLLERHQHLAADDILQLIALPSYDSMLQVIDSVHEKVTTHPALVAVPDTLTSHECPDCHLVFVNLSALRRHCTVEHGRRSGLIRPLSTQPVSDTPTCLRCSMQFSTWHRLHYHLRFVCVADLQEIDQVEHRLRVQELLQLARAHQVAALCQHATLLMYLLHHCVICGKFHMTHTGLMRHWNDDHASTYRNHLPALQYYCDNVELSNPCQFCSTSFAQYHPCIIWRQLAMLLTERDLTTEYCDVTAAALIVCDICGKAYTTKHGLAQHVQKFHSAQQVLHDSNWHHFTIKCLFDQAVQTNRCEDLITNPDVLHFISSECFDCSMPFRRRQDLSKHLKQGHPSEWMEMEQRASELTTRLNCTHRCLCDPPLHRVKHLCTVFLQFALARIHWEREQHADVPGPPPALALQPQEKMEQLLWMGYGHLLYRLPELKRALTLHCQICGHSCRCGDELALHIHQQHEALVAESSILLQLLRWILFQDFGCACNPTRGFGVPGHTCPALLQAAMMGVQAHWQILLPWIFRASELLSHIGDLLPLAAFRRISLRLITRQFEHLWRDPDLMRMLKSYCTICGETVSLQYILAHLRLEHQLGPNDLHPVVMQLCRIFTAEHSDAPYCDHCGELLPTLDIMEFDPVPEIHLPGCPLIQHLAAFLMHPVLHKQPYDHLAWPTPQAVEAAFQRQDHQRLMFNVCPSDTDGKDFDTLVLCGLQYLHDDMIMEIIDSHCLMCHRLFLLPGALIQHVKLHDYKQYNTMWCLRRLQLICNPCPCCGSDPHPENFVCPALLNLAILLTNGRRSRQGEYDLGQLVDRKSAPELGHQRRREGPTKQKTTKKGSQCVNLSYFSRRTGLDEGDGETHPPPRGHHSCLTSGVRVCPLDPTGRGQSTASVDGLSSRMAEKCQESIPAAYDGIENDRDLEGSVGQIAESTAQCGCGTGLHQVSPHRCQSDDAISTLGCGSTGIAADEGQTLANWRGESHPPDDPSDLAVRAGDHTQVSFDFEASDSRGPRESSSFPVDSGQQDARGTVESLANHIMSQHLATCEIDVAAPNTAKDCAGEAIGQDVVDDKPKLMVRVLENDSSTMCFVNAALIGLAWCSLLCQGFSPSCWAHGFELLRGLCQWNPLPLNLRVFQPFLWLLFGAFQPGDLSEQQDILEFTAFIIDRLGPSFLSCRWCTRFQFVTHETHPMLDREKGDRYAPILIRFIHYLDLACNLTDLIAHWHDSLGVCRASDQERHCLILMFDRHSEGQNRKCTQKIQISGDTVHFPCFAAADGQVAFLPFRIAAISYHIGANPNTGHHRTALKYQGHWLVYDDNKLPEHVHILSDEILCNITMIWLILPNFTAVRTMDRNPIRDAALAPISLSAGSSPQDAGDMTSTEPPACSAILTSASSTDERRADLSAPTDSSESVTKRARKDAT